MKKKERLENIENMESIFNELESSLKDIEISFKKRKHLFPKFKNLMKYYGDKQWKKDYDDVNNGRLKPKGTHGILGEDTIYHFYENQRDLCEDMIKFSNKVLKN